MELRQKCGQIRSPKLWRDFNNGQVSIEQRISDTLTVQAAYFHNETDARARSFVYNGNNMDLLGDPNLTLPASSGTGTVTNPRAILADQPLVAVPPVEIRRTWMQRIRQLLEGE